MNKRRLLKLADLLETDAKNKKGIKFDLGSWGESKDKPSVSCGTTACAMGLAALSGAFKSAGLRAEVSRPCGNYEISVFMRGHGYGLDAASGLFDITFNEAEWLFTPDFYDVLDRTGARGERAVAKRIRSLVAGEGIQ